MNKHLCEILLAGKNLDELRKFPVELRVSPEFVEALYGCEYGSFEESGCGENLLDWFTQEHLDEGISAHLCDRLGRHKNMIACLNAAELCDTYWHVCTSTIKRYGGKHGVRTAESVAKRLLRHIYAQWDTLTDLQKELTNERLPSFDDAQHFDAWGGHDNE